MKVRAAAHFELVKYSCSVQHIVVILIYNHTSDSKVTPALTRIQTLVHGFLYYTSVYSCAIHLTKGHTIGLYDRKSRTSNRGGSTDSSQ